MKLRITWRRLVWSLLLCGSISLGASRVFCAEAPPPPPPGAANASNDDHLNPRQFLTITELDKSGRRRPVQCSHPEACPETGSSCVSGPSAAPEVDIQSQLLIQFDRRQIQEWGSDFEAAITITGQVKSGDASREIEIPGYSLVGKAKSTASANLRSPNVLVPSISQVIATAVVIGSTIAQAPDSDGITSSKECKSHDAAMSALRRFARDVDVSDRDTNAIVQGVREYGVDLTVALTKLADKNNGPVLHAMLASLNYLRPDKATFGDADDLCVQASSALEAVNRLNSARVPFTNKDNGEDARIVARAFIRFAWLDDDKCKFPPEGKDLVGETKTRLLEALKDTSLVISQTGAKPGDLLILTITNNAEMTDSVRELAVPIRIEEFGWNSGVSDSALLIHRLGVNSADNAEKISQATAEVSSTQKQRQLTLPDPVDFAPAPGVTWGYTLTPRGHSFWRALEPGIGVNVSFPQFTETTTTISPGTPPSVVSSQSSKVFDVGAGPVVLLFNGALQFSYGWNLNVEQKRPYIAIGFGFVKVIEKLQSLAGH